MTGATARAMRAWSRRLSSAAPAASAGDGAAGASERRLADCFPKEVVDDIYRCSYKRQTGVSLKCALPSVTRSHPNPFGADPLTRGAAQT